MIDRLKRRRNAIKKLLKLVFLGVEELLKGGGPQDEDLLLDLATSEATAKYLLEEKKFHYI